ncbi:MAG: hypothetical protein ACI935_000362 [Moritella dasanensis]|jgi:hypothetical protein
MLKIEYKETLLKCRSTSFHPCQADLHSIFFASLQQLCCTSLVDRRKPPKKIQQTHIDLLIYMCVILVTSDYINSADSVSGNMAN